MKAPRLTKMHRFHSLVLATVMTVALPVIALAESHSIRQFEIEGINVTGANDRCGEPVMRYQVEKIPDFPLAEDFGGSFVGAFNSDGDDALPLTPENCDDDTVLVTHTDDDFLAGLGLPEADVRILNIPLREVPINVAPFELRSAVPPSRVASPNPFPPTKSEPTTPIRLGGWLSTRGNMTIKCRDNGPAWVRISFENLIPNGIYTMWGLWGTTAPGAPGPSLVPVPFGGVPNAFVPGRGGRAVFTRRLPACPMDTTPDGSVLFFVSTAYHSDGSLYGATPELPFVEHQFVDANGNPFVSVLPPGVVDHDQMNFPINSVPIQNDDR